MISTILLCTVLYCSSLQPTEVVREIDYITVDGREVAPVVDIAEHLLHTTALEVAICNGDKLVTKLRPEQLEWGRIRVTGDIKLCIRSSHVQKNRPTVYSDKVVHGGSY